MRIALIVACLLLLTGSNPRAGVAQISNDLAAGDERYEALDNQGALVFYEQARADAAFDFDVLYRIARTYNDYGWDFAMAGEAQPAERELVQAVEAAGQMVVKYPDRAESWFLMAATRGNLALFKGGKEKVRTGRAVEEFCLRAIAIDPTYALPHLALGIFYREVDRLNWIQRTLANALFGGLPEGSVEMAIEQFEQALELDPDLPAAHFELGVTLDEIGRGLDAVRHLQSAASLPPRNTQDRRNAIEAQSMLRSRQ